jgi:aryl-alcohol dehydrogenase-like predicted oxidoreductase
MGTYTGPATDEGDRQYAESVQEAVRRGVNVIDCAINYRHMRSERAVGRGLGALFEAGGASRDEVLVMTKGGYLPFDGAAPRNIAEYLRRTYLDSNLVKPNEIVAGSHCIAPKFLENQLQRSLQNLGLDAVDVYFLHNVEQQLEEVSLEEFERRVLDAFRFLEAMVGRGVIGFYGVATWNGFRVTPESKGHLSLERLFALAHDAGGPGHRFRVLQLPYNLGMPEALSAPTQSLAGKRVPLLEAASAYGMMVVTSVPLLQTQLLPHVPPVFSDRMPGLSTNAQRALQFVRSTPGVHAPLVGMRSPEHVRENTVLAGVPPLPQAEFFRLIAGERS